MKTDSMTADFLAARSKTMTTIMNATGWKPGVVNPEHISVDSVFVYVFDYQSKWTWCCSIPRNMFDLAVQHAKSKREDHQISFCEHLIAEAVACSASNPVDENQLGFALASYLSVTKSYSLTQGATKANHFVVIRYGRIGTLRPFAMSGPARHLLVEQKVADAIQHVVAMDAKNHPEYVSQT